MEDPKIKGKYNPVLRLFIQDPERKTRKAIESLVFTAASPEPPATGTNSTTGDKPLGASLADNPAARLKKILRKVEEGRARHHASERGVAPMAMNSIGKAWPLLGSSAVELSIQSTPCSRILRRRGLEQARELAALSHITSMRRDGSQRLNLDPEHSAAALIWGRIG